MSRYRIPLDLANQASPPPDEEEVRQACAEVEARLRSLFPQHELVLVPSLVFAEVEGAASDLTEVLRAARDLCRDWLATRRGGKQDFASSFVARWGLKPRELPDRQAQDVFRRWAAAFDLEIAPGRGYPWDNVLAALGRPSRRSAAHKLYAQTPARWFILWWDSKSVWSLEGPLPPPAALEELAGQEVYLTDAEFRWTYLIDHEGFGPFFLERALETEAEVRTPRTSAARLVRLEETRDRSFDREFWLAASPAERFRAGWQLVEDYLALRGRLDERRLRRSVAELRPLRG